MNVSWDSHLQWGSTLSHSQYNQHCHCIYFCPAGTSPCFVSCRVTLLCPHRATLVFTNPISGLPYFLKFTFCCTGRQALLLQVVSPVTAHSHFWRTPTSMTVNSPCVLGGFFDNFTQARWRTLSWENISIIYVCRAFSWLVIDQDGPEYCEYGHTWAVGLGLYKKSG